MNEDRASHALDGLVIGVPAARRAIETAKLIERWGGTALVGPTVEEVPVEDEGQVLRATADVIESGVPWSIHLTGVGTRRWFEAAARGALLEPLLSTLEAARLIPRGAKASAVLKDYGLGFAWMPEGETSREIAEWLGPQISEGDAVALQRHGEPVPGLSSPLEEAGARMIDLITYRWEIPNDRGPAERLVTALVDGGAHALVITSAPQVRHLFGVAEGLGMRDRLQAALADRVYLAAVGTVAAAAFQREGLAADLIAQPPRLGALVRALAAAREAVDAKSGTT
ncbi:MAG: uroporphyrinogen-III synthase [Actinomycetota bacterium]